MNTKNVFPVYETEFKKLAEAIQCYLSYLALVTKNGKNNFILESAIRFPLAEYIERRFSELKILELEHNYSFFLGKKRCDIYIERNDGLKFYIELKYIRQSIDLQYYFNDILRLFFASKNTSKNKAFFIVCGESFNFASLNNTHISQNKYYTEQTNPTKKKKRKSPLCKWLSLNPDKPIKIITTKGNKKLWKTFIEEYFNSNIQDEEHYQIETKLLTYLSASNMNGQISVAVWEIKYKIHK